MIRLTTVYHHAPDAYFDFDYHINTHLVMAERLLGNSGMLGIPGAASHPETGRE